MENDAIILFVFMFAIIFGLFASVAWSAGAKATYWTKGEALVTRAAIGEKEVSRNRAKVTHYYVKVEYSYEVNGQKYTGEYIISHSEKYMAIQTQQTMRAGLIIPVYYDPKNPQKNSLVQGGYTIFLILTILSLSLGGVGLVLSWL